MKNCLSLAIAVLIGFTSNAALAGGSLAARAEAAQAQAAQLRAAQLQAAQLQAAQAARSQIQDLAPSSGQPPVAEPERSSSGRINVADWFNQTPDSQPQTQPQTTVTVPQPSQRNSFESQPIDRASIEPPRMASSRRQASPRPLPTQNPTPVPPIHSDPASPPLTAASPESSSELLHLTPDEPAALPTTDGALLELHAAGGETAPLTESEEEATELVADSEEEATEIFSAIEREAAEMFAEIDNDATGTVPDIEEGATETVTDKDDDAELPAESADLQEDEDSEESTPAESTPAEPKKEFSPTMLQLRDRIRSTLTYYYQRPESVSERSPWGVMHAMISYGVDAEIQTGRQRANAIGWLCYNRPCRGMKLLQFDGKYPAPRNGPGYQGHEGQFLSMLALSRVKPTYPIRVDGHDFTVQDLIEYEKYTCRPKTELTFKLIALAHYLPSDATWTSKWGETWSIERLIKEELAQPINGACCGGTHRLIGYSMAVKVRQKRGEPLDGQWLRAQKYVDSYHKYVIKLQNRDGSFSTSWLQKRDGTGDIDRRVQTTGHILEWLAFSLPENELTDPRIVRAATFLNSAMSNYRQKEWEIGPRGHALRALALYNERVFGDKPGERRALLARRPQK